jgi:hypothetical protein
VDSLDEVKDVLGRSSREVVRGICGVSCARVVVKMRVSAVHEVLLAKLLEMHVRCFSFGTAPARLALASPELLFVFPRLPSVGFPLIKYTHLTRAPVTIVVWLCSVSVS